MVKDPASHQPGMYEMLVKNGDFNYQPQVVNAGFLKHQQYVVFLHDSITFGGCLKINHLTTGH